MQTQSENKPAKLLAGLYSEKERRKHRREQGELLTNSLRDFVRASWHVVEPANPYLHNWHIDAISEHLEAVAGGQIQYLLINVPPGTAKSLICSVQFPAWLWLKKPEDRLICGTYAHKLTVRDAVRSRSLLTSPWYAETFQPTWKLRDDSNEKDLYYNTASGFRLAVSVTGQGTGHRGSGVILDDILSVDESYSDTERERACRWVRQTMSSRRNNLAKDWQIAIGQRLHESDPYAEMLASGDYQHLCLPSEFEMGRRSVTSIGFADPRQVEGELLFPALFPPAVLAKAKRDMGEYAYAGQHQQRPSPAGGGIFKADWWKFYTEKPAKFDVVIQSWDLAFKDTDGSDYVVGQVWGKLGANKYLLDQARDRMSFTATKQAIRAMSQKWPEATLKLVEDKANGPAVIDSLKDEITGIVAVNPEGGKEARAHAVSPEVEAGNVWLPRDAAYTDGYLYEMGVFPNGAHDDQVDATTQALNRLRNMSGGLMAYLQNPGFYDAQIEAKRKAGLI